MEVEVNQLAGGGSDGPLAGGLVAVATGEAHGGQVSPGRARQDLGPTTSRGYTTTGDRGLCRGLKC